MYLTLRQFVNESYLEVVRLQHYRPSIPAQVGASGTREERLVPVAVAAADYAGQPAACGTCTGFS